jgi:hypothetical protein
MSDFARGVVGVLAAGTIAGVGALLLIPQPSPSTMRFAEPVAKPCGQQTWPETDRICQKWTAPQRAGAHTGSGAHKQDGASAEPSPAQADTGTQAESVAPAQPARATASRSAQNVRAAQRRRTEGLQMMRGFGDNLSDVRASAYAPDGTRRTTTARPTSRQNTNSSGGRAAQGNGFFPLFR